MSEYFNKVYYIITTPAIVDTDQNSPFSVYNYHLSKSNDISRDYYIIDGITKNTLYYDDIVFYKPTDMYGTIKSYTGININSVALDINGNYTYTIQNNLFELSKYISNRLLYFIQKIQLANKCNKLKETHKIFALFGTTECNDFSLNTLNNPLYLPLYHTIPNNITESIPNDNITKIKKKHLLQENNDLKNLISSFSKILQLIPSTNDNYANIIKQHNENLQLRNDLDRKLAEIYQYKNSSIVKSEIDLDNTVYTGVLWSILATSLAYFVFIKL